MSNVVKVEDPVIFPNDLSPKRYISFDFYAPELGSEIVSAAGSAVQAVSQGISGNTSGALKSAAAAGDNIVNTLDVVKNSFTERFSVDENGKVEGNVASTNIKMDAKTYRGTIFMPLTNGINEALNNSYSEEQGAVSSLLGNIAGPNSMAGKIMGDMAKFTGTRALLSNPDAVQTYKGTGLRMVVMTWSLMPRNFEEAEQITKIVRLFKRYASPETQAAQALLLAPPFCQITITNPILDDALRYEEMNIESVTVDYGVSGAMETFSDGMLKEINLNVKFIERRMKTYDDWAEKDNRKARTGDHLPSVEGEL